MQSRIRVGSIVSIIAIVVFDQVTKLIMERVIVSHGPVVVIPGLFNLVLVKNPGGAFGIFAGQDPLIRALFFILFTLIAMGLLVYLYIHAEDRAHRFAYSLILAGAAGNLIDRLRFGYVIDFLDFSIKGYHWPAFNIADSAITIGMALFGFLIFFNPKH